MYVFMRRMAVSTQEKFRKELIKRDQSCILSGLCHEVCEAAHLVNKEWFKTSNKEHKFTQSNGILLNSNLHKEFDLHYWTIDIYKSNWEEINRKIEEGKLENYKCDIKLYSNGQKKLETNMKLEIFDYIETGINIPVECLPFIIKRNEIYSTIYLKNQYSLKDIDTVLKSEFKPTVSKKRKRKVKKGSKKEVKSKDGKRKIIKSVKRHKLVKEVNDIKILVSSTVPENVPNKVEKPETKRKKRVRYSKLLNKNIHDWISDLEKYPNKTEIGRFSILYNLDKSVFEKRLLKLWVNKT